MVARSELHDTISPTLARHAGVREQLRQLAAHRRSCHLRLDLKSLQQASTPRQLGQHRCNKSTCPSYKLMKQRIRCHRIHRELLDLKPVVDGPRVAVVLQHLSSCKIKQQIGTATRRMVCWPTTIKLACLHLEQSFQATTTATLISRMSYVCRRVNIPMMKRWSW